MSLTDLRARIDQHQPASLLPRSQANHRSTAIKVAMQKPPARRAKAHGPEHYCTQAQPILTAVGAANLLAWPPFTIVLLGEIVAFVDQPVVVTPASNRQHFAVEAKPVQALFHSSNPVRHTCDGLTIWRRIHQMCSFLLQAHF